MTREEAIKKITEYDLASVDVQFREEAIETCWNVLVPGCEEFNNLPLALQEKLKTHKFSKDVEDMQDPIFDPLVKTFLTPNYILAHNLYLSQKIKSLGYSNHKVTGHEPELLACPCCFYKTKGERGNFTICPVCNWEDDGRNEDSDFSGPNHIALGKRRQNFQELGACDKRSLKCIDTEGSQKYYKA